MEAFERLLDSDTVIATVVIANTVKGKNVSFMERQIKWHAGSLNEADLATALKDIDEAFEKQKEGL